MMIYELAPTLSIWESIYLFIYLFFLPYYNYMELKCVKLIASNFQVTHIKNTAKDIPNTVHFFSHPSYMVNSFCYFVSGRS
jgi:hypothetical protein